MNRVEQVQSILLIRAFEQSEPAAGWFPEGRKEAATAAAAAEAGLSAADTDIDPASLRRAVGERAARLLPDLDARFPSLRHLRTGTRGTSTVISLLLAGAFIVGLASNLLAPGRQIHLLSVPLWGLLLWNVGLLLSLPFKALLRRQANGGGGGAERGRLWTSIAVGIAARVARGTSGDRAFELGIARFVESWRQVGGAWVGSRLLRLLHAGAALMVVGLIAGMYQRGIALEYRAAWESTWLDAAAVQNLMNLLLGPASALSGIAVPAVAPLQLPGSGVAAPWIHLFAVTALLFVGIPRGILWGLESLRLARLARELQPDWDDPYFRKIFSVHRGRRAAVALVPFSFSPSAPLLARIKDAMFGALGAAAEIRAIEPVPYGGELREIWEPWMDRCVIALLFSAAQSPESEVHDQFVREWTVRCGAARIVCLLDLSGYADRVASGSRVAERLEAWRRALQESGTPLVALPAAADEKDWLRELAPRLDRAVSATLAVADTDSGLEGRR